MAVGWSRQQIADVAGVLQHHMPSAWEQREQL